MENNIAARCVMTGESRGLPKLGFLHFVRPGKKIPSTTTTNINKNNNYYKALIECKLPGTVVQDLDQKVFAAFK